MAVGTKQTSFVPQIPQTQTLTASLDSEKLVLSVESYLRFWDESPSWDGEAAVDGAEVLSHDGETTPLSAARTGRQPLRGAKRSIQRCNK